MQLSCYGRNTTHAGSSNTRTCRDGAVTCPYTFLMSSSSREMLAPVRDRSTIAPDATVEKTSGWSGRDQPKGPLLVRTSDICRRAKQRTLTALHWSLMHVKVLLHGHLSSRRRRQRACGRSAPQHMLQLQCRYHAACGKMHVQR